MADVHERSLDVVVVAGAGARGAYEAGALAKLLPELYPNGLGSVVLLGTSAGAINAALWASRATKGRPMAEIAAEVEQVWREIRRENVFHIPVHLYAGLGAGGTADFVQTLQREITGAVSGSIKDLLTPLNYLPFVGPALRNALGDLTGVIAGSVNDAVSATFGFVTMPVARPFSELGALLDTSPLWDTAKKYVDFADLKKNIDEGRVGGIGVVATSSPVDGSGGRSRVFLQLNKGKLPRSEPDSSLDYVPTELAAQHVLASAAIPVAFSPVNITTSKEHNGFHIDGGVRLNAPIEPAIKLGAARVVVVSSHATAYPTTTPGAAVRPDVLDVAAQSIHAVLADGMIEDLRNLQRINTLVLESGNKPVLSESGRPYRFVPLVKVSPPNGVLSPIAAGVARKVSAPLDRTFLQFLSRLGSANGRNELLSYLLFEPEYADKQIELGEAHASEALRHLS